MTLTRGKKWTRTAGWKKAIADQGWSQENPDKRRRLAYMKARYGRPKTCSRCATTAHWTWGEKNAPYCDQHLPAPARAALNRLQDNLFVVAPFFDEPEEDTSAWDQPN